jgi:pimeloyl-ACP methyl ester carboxylesterase
MTDLRNTLTTTLIDGAEVAYTDSGGDGEPLLLMHGGGLADWMTPLAAELGGYRVIRLVRAGSTGGPLPAGLTVADHARHAATLLHRLGCGPAHVVAHSSSSAIALRLIAHLAGVLPQATIETVEDADHLMPLTAPATLAALISRVTNTAVAGRGVAQG